MKEHQNSSNLRLALLKISENSNHIIIIIVSIYLLSAYYGLNTVVEYL